MALEIGSLVWTLEVKCILGRIELKVGWRDCVISGLYRALRDSQGMRMVGSASGIGLNKLKVMFCPIGVQRSLSDLHLYKL